MTKTEARTLLRALVSFHFKSAYNVAKPVCIQSWVVKFMQQVEKAARKEHGVYIQFRIVLLIQLYYAGTCLQTP